MAKAPRASLSVSGGCFEKLEAWCKERDIPISAVVEIIAARAIGMPLSQLPKTTQRWIEKVPEKVTER